MTSNCSSSAVPPSRTHADWTPEYFDAFCSASRTQKYTAASASCVYRPTSVASIRTSIGAFRAWDWIAATRPWSASRGG